MNLANARAQFSPYANRMVYGAAQLAENALLKFCPRHESNPLRVVPANPIDVDLRRRLEIIEHDLFMFPLPVEFEQCQRSRGDREPP